MNERELLTVTNGQKLYKIVPEQLPQALAQGLSCPVASAQTLVGNGEYLFEIPVEFGGSILSSQKACLTAFGTGVFPLASP